MNAFGNVCEWGLGVNDKQIYIPPQKVSLTYCQDYTVVLPSNTSSIKKTGNKVILRPNPTLIFTS